MNDYFDQLERELVGAVAKRRHLPWYSRVRLPRGRRGGVLLVLVGLVIATPAVAAVSGWFSAGQPDSYRQASPVRGYGTVLSGGSHLLRLRVTDPGGGPAWGMRVVRTTRADTCIQIGRVRGGQIGSLGIDGAWHNDHEFHPIVANDGYADECDATDGAGVGFVSVAESDMPASVFVPGAKGPKLTGPQSGMRMIFAGLLGPQAKSITYRTPSGQTHTQRTVGKFGAYMIVFRQTLANCFAFGSKVPGERCMPGLSNRRGVQPATAILGIAYKNGTVCLVSAVRNGPGCKPFGWVPVRTPKLMDKDVISPLTVHFAWSKGDLFAQQPQQRLIKVSFTAHEPVTRADSGYELTLTKPLAGGAETNADIRRGQRVTLIGRLPNWRGGYRVKVTFRQHIGQADERTLTVGTASFKHPPAG